MSDVEKRKTFIGSIERALAFVSDNRGENALLEDLQERGKRMQTAWISFQEEHMLIVEALLTDDDAGKKLQNDVFAETEEKYLQASAWFARRINALANPINITVTNTPPHASAALDDNGNSSQHAADSARDATNNPGVINPVHLLDIDENRRVVDQNVAGTVQRNTTDSNANNQSVPTERQNLQIMIPNPYAFNPGGLLAQQDLPQFSGIYSEWPAFRDLFKQLVDENQHLTHIAKFNILVRHLRGAAAGYAAGLSPSFENYKVIWGALNAEYNDPRRLINSILESLRQLKTMTGSHTPSLHYIVIKFRQGYRQLEANGADVKSWDPMLQFDLLRLLDEDTKTFIEERQLTRKQTGKPLLIVPEILALLENRVRARNQGNSHSNQRTQRESPPAARERGRSSQQATVGHVAASKQPSQASEDCPICKTNQHSIESCSKFLELNPFPRMKRAGKLGLCFGCLSSSHSLAECVTNICNFCTTGKKHHPLLCFKRCDEMRNRSALVAFVGRQFPQEPYELEPFEREAFENDEEIPDMEVVIATALINVRAADGTLFTARAMCDTGSQANLISEDFLRRLRLTRNTTITSVNPVGDLPGFRTRGSVHITIAPIGTQNAHQRLIIHAYVLNRIATTLPSNQINIGEWPVEVTNNLADPTLREPGRIDILLGAHVWSRIAMAAIVRNDTNGLMAQRSRFGWLIFGGLISPSTPMVGTICFDENDDRNIYIATGQVFQLNESKKNSRRSVEHQECEDIFARMTHRKADGRYVVPMPIKSDALPLGDSRRTAYRRYMQLERKFEKNPKYYQQYVKFMQDYIDKGHMSLLQTPFNPNEPHYFIPHHGIDNGKFRVVFDGSATTSSGESLNDVQLLGERLQDNLPDIILRFRLHSVAMTADVAQMYRQVELLEEHRKFQLIFWRSPHSSHPAIYQLNTVTYGLKHSAHTAVRTLQQCADDAREKYPKAAAVAKIDYYMDDLATGADDADEAIDLYNQMTNMMEEGGFPLRKWVSNDWNVMQAIGDDENNTHLVALDS